MKSKLLTMILLLSMSVSLFGQVRISGVVTDTAGPVVGASVIEKSTASNGTITAEDGSFSLSVRQGATIVISSIGYKDQEIAIGNQTRFNVFLEEDSELLEETVVIGYGTQKKSDVTGSVASVDSEMMNKRSPVNLAQGLQGAAAGVVITQSSGDPTGGANIRIRGVATMNGDTNPLWVVDGVQYGTSSNLTWLDPMDVEHIEILKDASATAIYGARGANGVIMVTTRKGQAGQARINFRGDFGVSTNAGKLQVANLQDWLKAYRQSIETDGKSGFTAWTGPYDNQLNEIDWQDVMSQTGFRQQYNLSVSGGSEAARVNWSVGYLDNTGVIVNTWQKRFNMRLNADFTLKKWLKSGVAMNFHTSKGNGGGNMMSIARTTPTMDYVDANGKLVNVKVIEDDGSFGHFTWENESRIGPGIYATNPLASQTYRQFGEDYNSYSGTTRMSAYAEITFFKGFTFRTNLNYDFQGSNSWSYTPVHIFTQEDFSANNAQDSFSTSGSASVSIGAENYFTYDRTWGKSHFTAMVGQSASNYVGSSNSSATRDLTFPFLRGFFSTNPNGYDEGDGGPYIATKFASYFARLNYVFGGKYMLTATIRRDGSSNFGKKNRWGTFPSFSAAWNIGEEPFIKVIAWWDVFKIRAGWGTTGNANVSSTASVPQLSSSGVSFDTFDSVHNYTQHIGFAQTKEIDQGLKWETSVQTNVGLDLAFLKNSITASVDYYIRDTKDLILSKTIRPSAGYQSITTNFGSIRNTGWEFALGYKKQFNRDWFFSANATASTNKNEAIDIGAGTTISGDKGSAWEDRQVCYNGLALGTYQGYAVDYIFRDQAEVDALNAKAVEKYGPGSYWDKATTGPGDFKYKDLNGDGHITADDKYYMGNGFADLVYGLTLNANYRNWDASMYMYGALGQKILSWSKCYLTAISSNTEGYFNFLSEVVNDSWTKSNPNAKYPRISQDDLSYNKRVSDYFVEDGSYLKISTIQIGYTFPQKVLGKVFRSARAYATVQNLLTISPYTKYGDPEVSPGVTTTGYDSGRYPFPRTFMFGFQLGL